MGVNHARRILERSAHLDQRHELAHQFRYLPANSLNPNDPSMIVTLRGLGYLFISERPSSAAEPSFDSNNSF